MEAEKKRQLEEYRRRQFAKNEDHNLYCVCVDGSKHSNYGFELVVHHFLKPEERLLLVHIFNEKLDEQYNYENKKETVLSTFNDKLIPYESQSFFFSEDRQSEIHVLEQVNKIGSKYRADYLVVGLFGIKGPKADKKELSKGVNYLLGNTKMPVILVQENLEKKYKENKRFNWLFVFDRQYSYCQKIMNTFFPLVGENDLVSGLTLLPHFIHFDDVEKDFMTETETRGFKNITYEKVQYELNSYAKELTDKVNFGSTNYDFVVFYSNNDKYRVQGEKSDSYYLVSKCKANLCFVY